MHEEEPSGVEGGIPLFETPGIHLREPRTELFVEDPKQANSEQVSC
jgi:hypothetical protein